ncbi:hypothetical protein FQZ97_576470 [compost metagenome]
MWVATVWRIRRRAAAQGDGGEAQPRAGGNLERRAGEVDGVPGEATVPVLEHAEQWEAAGEVLVDHVGAPDRVRAALTQAEQAGDVVDLAVEQDDRLDSGIPRAAGRLQRREGFELGADVRRGVAQHPVAAVGAEGDGRLGARLGTHLATAHAAAVVAIAVPLGEAATGSRAKDLNMHSFLYTLNKAKAPANRGTPISD